MGEKVYFVDDGKIVVSCPRCRFTKMVPAAKYLCHPANVKLRLKCRCGFVHTAFLERRLQRRKSTRLEGIYVYLTDKFIHTEGGILVRDLSSCGIGFSFLDDPGIVPLPGDRLSVRFRINRLADASFAKEVLVKSFRGTRVGARFLKKISYETDKVLKIFLSG